MKQKKTKSYLVVIAICLALIGLMAAYFAPLYENSIQGTSERGIYNGLIYISTACIIGYAILFYELLNRKFSRNKNDI